ncbi:MAG TPA: alpha-hydroxy acid oxidase [Candidatus Limnocylindrales bacterium]
MSTFSALDFAALARANIDPLAWDYIEGGGGAELTLQANRALFDSALLRPRVLVDVTRVDTSTRLLGCDLSSPIGIAPVAYQRMAFDEGEVATARALDGSLMAVSIFASRTIEEIAQAATGPLWMQLYWMRERRVLVDLVKRAQSAGFKAIVLTVDAPRIGRRLRDIRNNFGVPAHMSAVNIEPELMATVHGADGIAEHARLTFDQSITWSDLSWLKGLSDLPLIIKGILTAEDAALAVEHGADAIVVSNHGGRQLDGAVPSMRALPEVVAAVAGRCPVLLDGGVRHGRDAFIALALGASAVLVGRPALWALACAGTDGVSRLLGILREELEHTMALSGRPAVARIDRSALA